MNHRLLAEERIVPPNVAYTPLSPPAAATPQPTPPSTPPPPLAPPPSTPPSTPPPTTTPPQSYPCDAPSCATCYSTAAYAKAHMLTCPHYISTLSSAGARLSFQTALGGAAAATAATAATDWLTLLAFAQHSRHITRAELSQALLVACAPGAPASALHVLLARGADADVRDAHFSTPLMRAARAGAVAAVRALLRCGADVRSLDRYGMTALHHAAAAADGADGVEIGALLLAAGADVDAVNRRNRTPLDMAFVRNRSERFLALLEG